MKRMESEDFSKFFETLHAVAAAPTEKEVLLLRRDHVMFELMSKCCLWPGQVLSLDVESVCAAGPETTLRVSSRDGTSRYFIPLLSPSLERLQEYLADVRPRLAGAKKDRALFLSMRGNRLKCAALLHRFNKVLEAAGLGGKGYVMRSFRWAALTSQPIAAPRIFGDNIATTSLYTESPMGMKFLCDNKTYLDLTTFHPRQAVQTLKGGNNGNDFE